MTPRGGPRPHAGPPITKWNRLQPGKRCRLALPDGSTIAGEVLSVETTATIRMTNGALITITHGAPPGALAVDYDDATFAQQLAAAGLGPLATQDNPYTKKE